MSWKVDFYSDKVEDAIKKWPEGILAKFTWISSLIEDVGPDEVGMPHIKPMGQGCLK